MAILLPCETDSSVKSCELCEGHPNGCWLTGKTPFIEPAELPKIAQPLFDPLPVEFDNERGLTPTWIRTLEFDVIGTPQQRGSKTIVGKKGGGYVTTANGMPMIKDENEKSRAWMDAVAFTASQLWRNRALIAEPVALSIVFYFNRPKSHYRSGDPAKGLTAKAPRDCMTRKDLAKLIRCTEDALSGVIYRDDIQVCEYLEPIRREYTESSERAKIVVYTRG